MIERRLRDLWDSVFAKRPHMPHFLTQVRLRGIRGIKELEVDFMSPVVVIGGGNASGKSTLLAAIACAYDVPGAQHRAFHPATLFADYRPRQGAYEDARAPATIEFEYSTPDGGRAMRWQRASGWRQTFYGRRHAVQPQRPVHMHLMRNLDDPAEARDLVAGMMQGRAATQASPLTLCCRSGTRKWSISSGTAAACCLLGRPAVRLTRNCTWLPASGRYCACPKA